MAIVHRQSLDWPTSLVPERWRRLFDFDLEQDGWLRMEEFREGDQLVLRAELPGVDPDKDVDVVLDDGRLTVKARREMKEETKSKQGFHSEFRYGELSRSMAVPKGVAADDVKAKYEDGILEVRVPVPEEKEQSQKRVVVERS